MRESVVSTQPGVSRAQLLSRWTNLDEVARQLIDVPASGISAWARTTGGVVAFLLILQILSGVLLAFVYVPSAESAHATLAYTEKVLHGGSWIRALHFYCSQLLPLALLLHIMQMLLRGAYRRKPVAWLASLALLALVFANGATGYSLPWDARAYFSTSVGAGIAGGFPFFGASIRSWLTGGAEISTLTISRLYALHVLIVPTLILTLIVIRFFIMREQPTNAYLDEGNADENLRAGLPAQLTRHLLVIALVFVSLAFYASKFPAPLGPPADLAGAGYIPRPGAQFLWLFQLLKYFPPMLASLVAFFLPTSIIVALAALPFLRHGATGARAERRVRAFGLSVIALTSILVVTLTAIAHWEDARDPHTREQLARQSQQESEFRSAPFVPRSTGNVNPIAKNTTASNESGDAHQAANELSVPPAAYLQKCAKCHGQHGEGHSIFPQLTGVSTRPRRTLEDLVAIMNDPHAYGLESRMPSFANKLTEEEKQAIAQWIITLK